MALSPWGGFGYGPMMPYGGYGGFGAMDPFQDPFGFGAMDVFSGRTPFRRMFRDLDRFANEQMQSVREDDKSFQVMVDVSQFQPNEVTVKTTDKDIIVHAKHNERSDRHGFVTREFRRRVALPQGVNPETVTSTLSPDGVLTVMAPKLSIEGGRNERVIPIKPAPAAGSIGGTSFPQKDVQQGTQGTTQPQGATKTQGTTATAA